MIDSKAMHRGFPTGIEYGPMQAFRKGAMRSRDNSCNLIGQESESLHYSNLRVKCSGHKSHSCVAFTGEVLGRLGSLKILLLRANPKDDSAGSITPLHAINHFPSGNYK